MLGMWPVKMNTRSFYCVRLKFKHEVSAVTLERESSRRLHSLWGRGPYLLAGAEHRQHLAQCLAQRGACNELLSEEHTKE